MPSRRTEPHSSTVEHIRVCTTLSAVIYVLMLLSPIASLALDSVTAAPNHPPQQISALPTVELEQGTTLEDCVFLPDYFYDSDKDKLSYDWNCSHSTIGVKSDGHINVTAPEDWYGVEYAVIRATDPSGAFVEGLMQIVVTHVNHPPVIEGVPDLKVRYDVRYDFDLWPYVHDLDKSPQEFTYTVNDANCSFTGTVLSVLYPSSMNNTVNPITMTVTDGAHNATCTINIAVSADYPPVLFPGRLLPDLSLEEDNQTIFPTEHGLEYYFLDHEDGQVLNLSAISLNSNVSAAVFKNETGVWKVELNLTHDYFGSSYMLIRAADSVGAIVEQTIIIDVLPVPDPPVLDLPSTFTVIEGQQMILNIGGYVTDPDSSMFVGDFTFTVEIVNMSVSEADYLEWIGIYADALLFECPDGFLKSHNDSFTIEVAAIDQTGLVDRDQIVVVISTTSVGGNNNPLMLTAVVLATVGGISGIGAVAYVRRKRPFVVREMLLVHNDGFLIGRCGAHSHVEGDIDQDIFSGMLTAVLTFVEDSMHGSSEALKIFGFKEYQVLVGRGANVFAAIVHEGDLPKDIDVSIAKFLGTIERVYKKRILHPTGDVETDFAGVEILIQTFVKEHSQKLNRRIQRTWASRNGLNSHSQR